MMNFIISHIDRIGLSQNMTILASIAMFLVIMVILSWVAYFLTNRYITIFIRFMLKRSSPVWEISVTKYNVIYKISYLIPAIVIYKFAPLLVISGYKLLNTISNLIITLTELYIVFNIILIVISFINSMEDYYNTNFNVSRKIPIKSYLQVLKMVIIILSIIIVISNLLGKSPTALLTGIGATAIGLTFIFKETLLGLVASLQLTMHDMIRIGDWITLPQYDADGDVIEISLTTSKIKNFDNTITTIPTHVLLSTGVKNWRGMQESGGRRIKRSVNLNMNSIKFCNKKMLEKFSKIKLLEKYLLQKFNEIGIDALAAHDGEIDEQVINSRRFTNVGVFRAYVNAYLRENPKIYNTGFTFLVRQLAPTEIGLPLEIYIFTTSTNWVEYEHIQADIFDHLLAALPLFELKVYQNIIETMNIKLDNIADIKNVLS